MNKQDSTPIAAILFILVLGVVVIGSIAGVLLLCAGWFLYQSQPMQPPPAVGDSSVNPPPQPRPTPDLYERNMHSGSLAHASGDLETAIDDLSAAIEANSDSFDAYLTRGLVHHELGNWQAALADYKIAKELNPDDYAAWSKLAMLLAACPDDEFRNGAQAAEYAQKACELSEWKHPTVLKTMAIAYAELGDWQAATDICDAQLGQLKDGPMAEKFKVLRELFVQEKPYRLETTK